MEVINMPPDFPDMIQSVLVKPSSVFIKKKKKKEKKKKKCQDLSVAAHPRCVLVHVRLSARVFEHVTVTQALL